MGLLAYLKVRRTWRDIFAHSIHKAFNDNVFGMAAQLSYYFFFALFPALLLLMAIASYFPTQLLVDNAFNTLGGFVPPDAINIIIDQIKKITAAKPGGLLTFGVAAALWSCSSAMTAVINTLNSSYGVEEGRSWWKVQLTAICLTFGVAAFILVSFALVIVGPGVAERVAAWMHLSLALEWSWKILQWPFIFVLAGSGISLLYYFAPDVQQKWIWLTPGAIIATTLWLLTSLAFKYYVVNITSYSATYGAIGGVMVLMLWFYISGTVILLGAEMNAEIEHASSYGKEDGEKVAGEKSVIGAKSMRAWIARRRGHGDAPPSADEVKAAVEHKPGGKETSEAAATPPVDPAALITLDKKPA